MTNSSHSKKSDTTQKTKPKKGEPIEIPIPTESQIARDFTKIATAKTSDQDSDENAD
jgi:hypothetical protein